MGMGMGMVGMARALWGRLIEGMTLSLPLPENEFFVVRWCIYSSGIMHTKCRKLEVLLKI
jgi:hypothetical protein